MDKREQIIEALEMSYRYSNVDENNTLVPQEVVLDIIASMKAQEPVKPIMHYVPDGKRSSAAWQCGNCLIDIGYGANYCYNCGRAVKWDDNTAND